MSTVKKKAAPKAAVSTKVKAEVKKAVSKTNGKAKSKGHGVDLYAALHEHLGFDSFKGTQEAVINNLLAGNDTFVIMPTGGGKSLC